MISATVTKQLVETDCEHSSKKDAPGCSKPTPGKAAGGCAFDGAYSSLVPIADAAHIVHGPIGCLGNHWNSRGALSSGPKLYRSAFTTDLNNNDIVFGGEKKLVAAIEEIITDFSPKAVFVYQTCVTGMIGDDIQSICSTISKQRHIPVIPVEAPGFIGPKNYGNRLAGEAVLNHVIGTQEPCTEHPFNINLIGEFNIGGEFWNVLPLLDKMNVRLICSLSGDSRFHQVAMMHKAQLNVMVCSRALLNVARQLKTDYGIPYFEGSFYGARNTTETLKTIANHFQDHKLMDKTNTICKQENERIYHRLKPLKEILKGKKVLLYTGGVKSWSFVGALQELGMEVIATGAKKSTEEDKHRIRELMGDNTELVMDGSPNNLIRLYHQHQADVLLAGGRNQYTAIKARIPFVHVNQERESQFAGFEGFVNLAEEVVHAVTSPAYSLVQTPSPFQTNGLH